jgi:hypothetical protein
MNSKLAAMLTGFAIASLSLPTLAHHGSNVIYDLTQSTTINGTVTDFQFVNPHVQLFFEVTGEDGAIGSWLGGLPSSSGLGQNEGWTRDTLKRGDEITVTGAPARNDAPSVWIEQVTLNGEMLLGRHYTG